MRIIAYRTSLIKSKVMLEESTGDKTHADSPAQLFAFLLEPFEERHIKVCWELDATVAPILKLLGKTFCQKLWEKRKAYFDHYTEIFYVPGKVFSVEGLIKELGKTIFTKTRASLYDLAQYYPSLEEPENTSEVQMLGEKLMYELKKMELEPKKLTSPVAIYEECVMRNLDLPRLADMPKEVAEWAYKCASKLWIEAHQTGHFKQAYDYDLTSAFPMIARELEDFRQCEWVKSKKYQLEAVYGYARCMVTIYDWVIVSPIIKRLEDGSLVSPIGTWEEYLTKGELEFIDKWKIGEYKIVEGWWAMPSQQSKGIVPLKEPLDKLLMYKQRTGLQAALAKRMSVGVYGKLGEERTEEFGKYFNPVWFAEISTRVRLQVAEWLYSHKIGAGDNEGYQHLLHVSIDGVMLDCPAEIE